MENNTIRNIQQNLATSTARPIYSDEIVVAHTIKSGKDDKGKIMKEGHLQIVFIDMTTQKPVEKVVLSPITAKGLLKALSESLTKMDKEMKKKTVTVAKKSESTDYIR